MWTWRQLGYHDKPVGLLNTNGYYDALSTFLESAVAATLMDTWQMNLVQWGREPATLLEGLLNAVRAAAAKPDTQKPSLSDL